MTDQDLLSDRDVAALTQARYILDAARGVRAECGKCRAAIPDVREESCGKLGSAYGRNVLFTHLCPACVRTFGATAGAVEHPGTLRAVELFDNDRPLRKQASDLMNAALTVFVEQRALVHGARRMLHLEAEFAKLTREEVGSYGMIYKRGHARLTMAPYLWRDGEDDFTATEHASEAWAMATMVREGKARILLMRGRPIVMADNPRLIDRECKLQTAALRRAARKEAR